MNAGELPVLPWPMTIISFGVADFARKVREIIGVCPTDARDKGLVIPGGLAGNRCVPCLPADG